MCDCVYDLTAADQLPSFSKC